MKAQDNFKKSYLELILLKIILEGDCYGYQITQLIPQVTSNVIFVPEGSMYPVLYKLIENGYITDYKVKVGKRMERVYYHIEDSGRVYYEEIYASYKRLSEAIDTILNWKKEDQKEP